MLKKEKGSELTIDTSPRSRLATCACLTRSGHFFGFAFFTADFLAPFLALLLESPAVCSAIRYGPMSSFLPLFLYSLVNQLERVGPTIA